MTILNWNHPELTLNQGSSLLSQANAADTTLTLVNTKGFAINKLLLVGTLGSEDAEIVKTHASTAPTDSLVTLAAALKYSHSTDTPIVILDYDQIEISRSSTKGGSYAVIATIDMTVDEDATAYRDSSGVSSDYYKIRYKNSIDGSFSGYSAQIPATGFADETLAGMVDAVYTLFSKHSRKILFRTDIVKWLNEGYLHFASKLADLKKDFYVKYGTDGAGRIISFVANQRAYDLPDDFLRPIRWEFTYDGVNYMPADSMQSDDDSSTTVYSQNRPFYYYEDDKIVPRPMPIASTGGMRPRYVYMPAQLADDDEVPKLPLGHRTAPVNFALKRACESDQKFDVAQAYATAFDNEVTAALDEAQNRYPDTPVTIPMFGAVLDDDLPDGFTLPN